MKELEKRITDLEKEVADNQAEEHMRFRESKDYHCDNYYEHYIFEAVMEAVYGKGVWEYYNSLQE